MSKGFNGDCIDHDVQCAKLTVRVESMKTKANSVDGRLLSAVEMAMELDPTGRRITARSIRRLACQRKIPVVRLGYRSVFFDANAVRRALEIYEVKEIH